MQCRVLGCLQSTAIKMKNRAHNVMLNTYTLIVCTVLSFDLFNKLGSWCITRLTNVCAYMSPCVAIWQWYRTNYSFFSLLFVFWCSGSVSPCFNMLCFWRQCFYCTIFLQQPWLLHMSLCAAFKKKNLQIQPHTPLYNALWENAGFHNKYVINK